jgi:hypothetical protein
LVKLGFGMYGDYFYFGCGSKRQKQEKEEDAFCYHDIKTL